MKKQKNDQSGSGSVGKETTSSNEENLVFGESKKIKYVNHNYVNQNPNLQSGQKSWNRR